MGDRRTDIDCRLVGGPDVYHDTLVYQAVMCSRILCCDQASGRLYEYRYVADNEEGEALFIYNGTPKHSFEEADFEPVLEPVPPSLRSATMVARDSTEDDKAFWRLWVVFLVVVLVLAVAFIFN